MADLDALTALYSWCQDRNLRPRALSAGSLRVELGDGPPQPRVAPVVDSPPPADERVEARRSLERDLEVLLHSSGADVGALMARLG